MTVYIEYVFFNNFIIDMSLLSAAAKITRLRTHRLRIFIASLIGAVLSLCYPLLSENGFLIFFKILSGILLSFIAVKENFLTTIKHFSVFVAFTFLFGGCMYAIKNAVLLPEKFDELFIALEFIPAVIIYFMTLILLKIIVKTNELKNFSYRCEVKLSGKNFFTDGFLDSGNAVYFGFVPVCVCDKKFSETLKKELSDAPLSEVEEITINSFSGEKKTKIILNAEIIISNGQTTRIYKNVGLALTEREYKSRIILHGSFV